MSVVLLVRHGQASFGTHDYDRLSSRGVEQSWTLGAALSSRGLIPDRVITGAMTRQRQTAGAAARSAGWTTSAVVDPQWNEFDTGSLLAADPEAAHPDGLTDPRTFQRLLERASARWASGIHDEDYPETFGHFTARVDSALSAAVDGIGAGQTVVVFSSAGAIAWVAARLLDGGFPQWLALNRVAVNSGVTKLVVGRSGTSLIGFNDHCHLDDSAVTYR
ncbi:histidine phosphatase family protein [Flexivirga alba]|uniref:Histidine phosphatase family protein n=1 Tax=Flexivirga alba TaxID=702742 RepID=A0ABW2AJP1_9MICO